MNKESAGSLLSHRIIKQKHGAICDSLPLTKDFLEDMDISERIEYAILDGDDILFTAPARSPEMMEAYNAAASITGVYIKNAIREIAGYGSGEIVMLKLCKYCGAPFITRKIKNIHCSSECTVNYANDLKLNYWRKKKAENNYKSANNADNPSLPSPGNNTYWDDGHNSVTKAHFLLTLKEARRMNKDFGWAVDSFAETRDSQKDFARAGVKKWIENKKLPGWALIMGQEWYMKGGDIK